MASLNKVMLIGNLGADPERRQTQDGRAIVNFSLATSETWKDRNTQERRERTEWHKVVIFNENLAEVASRYLHKGSKVYVEGRIQTRKWQDQQGFDRWVTEVVLANFGGTLVLLGDGAGARNDSDDYRRPVGQENRPGDATRPQPADDMNDEIPF